MTHRTAKKPLAIGSAVAGLLFASLALAADAGPLDKASEQVSAAIVLLQNAKAGNKAGDEHLKRAKTALARAKTELLLAAEAAPDAPATPGPAE